MTFRQGNGFLFLMLPYQVTVVKVTEFLTLTLDTSNNRAERSIKPFVIDRKNFLFANTPRGANASAVVFSIIETAKENGLNPYTYLNYIFKNAPN